MISLLQKIILMMFENHSTTSFSSFIFFRHPAELMDGLLLNNKCGFNAVLLVDMPTSRGRKFSYPLQWDFATSTSS